MCSKQWLYTLMLLGLTGLGGCHSSSQDACTNPESSVQRLAGTLEEFAIILEQTPDTSDALEGIEARFSKERPFLESCIQVIGNNLQNMAPEQVLDQHENYLSDARVRRFLDAQDRFQERATAEQIEALEGLIAPLYLSDE